jgi:hypothetical protein
MLEYLIFWFKEAKIYCMYENRTQNLDLKKIYTLWYLLSSAAPARWAYGKGWPLGRLFKQMEFYSTCIIENIVWMTNFDMYLDVQTMNPTHFCPVQGFSSTEICQFWVKTWLMFQNLAKASSRCSRSYESIMKNGITKGAYYTHDPI